MDCLKQREEGCRGEGGADGKRREEDLAPSRGSSPPGAAGKGVANKWVGLGGAEQEVQGIFASPSTMKVLAEGWEDKGWAGGIRHLVTPEYSSNAGQKSCPSLRGPAGMDLESGVAMSPVVVC